jgi:hypothetical protein
MIEPWWSATSTPRLAIRRAADRVRRRVNLRLREIRINSAIGMGQKPMYGDRYYASVGPGGSVPCPPGSA